MFEIGNAIKLSKPNYFFIIMIFYRYFLCLFEGILPGFFDNVESQLPPFEFADIIKTVITRFNILLF